MDSIVKIDAKQYFLYFFHIFFKELDASQQTEGFALELESWRRDKKHVP
jgi:hypothetical protein